VVVGAGLSGVAIAWLLIANRLPSLDHLAMLRNIAAGTLAIVLMLVPVCRFRKHPSHVFASGLIAWSIVTLVYAILQIPFPRLAVRMGTFHFFILGALILGLASSLLWVTHLVVSLWHGPVVPARRAH
jgi:tellurite resistance protein TehA-like permease